MKWSQGFIAACCLYPAALVAAVAGVDINTIRDNAQTIVNDYSSRAGEQLSAVDLYKLSIAHDELRNKEAALASVNQGLQKSTEPYLTYELMLEKASIYGRLFRDTRKAIDILRQAEQQLGSLTQAEVNEVRARLYETFAQAFNQLGDLDQAGRYARLSVDEALRQQQPSQEIRSRLILGRVVLQQNNYNEAQRQLALALNLAKSVKQLAQVGSIELRLGMAYQKLGQYDEAITHFLQARQYYQQEKLSSQLVTIALNLADCYLNKGDVAAATAEVEQGKLLTEQQKSDPLLMAQVYYMQGMLADAQQQPQAAEDLLVRSLQLYQQQSQLTMSAEVSLALVTQLLARQDLAKANTYLNAVQTPDTLPLYLQQQWFDALAQLRAAENQWQQAFIAQQKASELRFRWVQQQEKFKLDGLQDQLRQQPLPPEKPTTAIPAWSQLLNVLLSIALLLVVLASTRLWRQRRHSASPARKSAMQSWQRFCQQVVQQHNEQPQLLIAIQLEQISQRKQLFGEHRVRQIWQELLQELPTAVATHYTVHTDTFWLHLDVTQGPALIEPLQQTLHRIALRLPSPTGFHIFSADLQQLLGFNWSVKALQGVRELVWSSWAHLAVPKRIQHIRASSTQASPVSWLAENVRADIDNAVQLGLLQFELLLDEPVELLR